MKAKLATELVSKDIAAQSKIVDGLLEQFKVAEPERAEAIGNQLSNARARLRRLQSMAQELQALEA